MATKKISDLQLRTNFDATCILPADDASQTWRVTGAQMLAYLGAALADGSTLEFVASVLRAKDAGITRAKLAAGALGAGNITTLSGSGNVGATDDYVLLTGAAWSPNLPAHAAGRKVTVKHNGTNLVVYTLTATSGYIDASGTTTRKLVSTGEAITLVSDGTNWYSESRRIPGDWNTYTPTLNSNTNVSTNTAKWRRVGDSIEVQGVVIMGAGGASPSNLTVSLPSGLTFDSAKLASGTGDHNAGSNLGWAVYSKSGTGYYTSGLSYNTSSSALFDLGQGSSTAVTLAASDRMGYRIIAPITNWEG